MLFSRKKIRIFLFATLTNVMECFPLSQTVQNAGHKSLNALPEQYVRNHASAQTQLQILVCKSQRRQAPTLMARRADCQCCEVAGEPSTAPAVRRMAGAWIPPNSRAWLQARHLNPSASSGRPHHGRRTAAAPAHLRGTAATPDARPCAAPAGPQLYAAPAFAVCLLLLVLFSSPATAAQAEAGSATADVQQQQQHLNLLASALSGESPPPLVMMMPHALYLSLPLYLSIYLPPSLSPSHPP